MTNRSLFLLPTCHLSLSMLKDPSDILAYCIRHYYSIPSNIYESFIDFEETFAKRLVEYQSQPEELKNVVEHDFTNYLNRIFNSNLDNTTSVLNIDISIETPVDLDLPTNFNNNEALNTLKKKYYKLITDIRVIINGKTYGVSSTILVQGKKTTLLYE